MQEIEKLLLIQEALCAIISSRKKVQKTAKEQIAEEAKNNLFAAYCAVGEEIKRILSNSSY